MNPDISREASGPVREFTALLPQGAQVLDAAGRPGGEFEKFQRLGFQVELIESSSLLLSRLQKEFYDGIWAHQLVRALPKHLCQRVMATFFATLKPRGVLFVSILENTTLEDSVAVPYRYRAGDFASLIRQSGFQVLSEGRSVQEPSHIGFLARRI